MRSEFPWIPAFAGMTLLREQGYMPRSLAI